MASKRYGYMCKYLKDNGYVPRVLTTRPRAGGFLSYKLDMEIPIPEDSIQRIGMLGIKYPVKEYAINLFLQSLKKQNKFSRIIEEGSLGWFDKVKEEVDLSDYADVDIIIGTFPEIGNVLVGEYISRKLKKPFVIEIRDLISDYSEGLNRGEFEEKLELFLEKCIISRAQGIITVTSGFQKILASRYARKKVMTVYNGWEFTQKKGGEILKENYIYYAGSLYEHRVESIELLLKTLFKNNIKTTVIIRSVGPQVLNEKLRLVIKKLNMEGQVILKEAANEKIVYDEQCKAKINLLVSSIHKEDKALMTTLPGKLFELISMESPVLAITDDSAEIGKILDCTNKGIATSKESRIVSFILKGYRSYTGNEKIADYSRKNQAKNLCGFLDTILGGAK